MEKRFFLMRDRRYVRIAAAPMNTPLRTSIRVKITFVTSLSYMSVALNVIESIKSKLSSVMKHKQYVLEDDTSKRRELKINPGK